jgi:hypothetical protein
MIIPNHATRELTVIGHFLNMHVVGNNQLMEAISRQIHQRVNCLEKLADTQNRRSQKTEETKECSGCCQSGSGTEGRRDEGWNITESSLEAETSLRDELNSICAELRFKSSTQARRSRISECFSDADIAVMIEPTFNNNMNQRSKSRNARLKSGFRRGLQAFVSKHTALSAAVLATAASCPRSQG